MKKFTYIQQITICFALFFVGSLSAEIGQTRIVQRIMVWICAILFFLHPVAPFSVEVKFPNKGKVIMRLIALFWLLLYEAI